ncbi:MAG: sulfotransferase family protein [Acidimicrobiia bacterium]|nr:sulfotransferase family protein [Acidimicrobiia bacterium]
MTDLTPGPARVIAVLGMHRSGTSCLTGSLQRAGLVLGRHHTWNRHNPKGNRENQDVVELHEDVLAANDGAWDRPPDTVVWHEEHLDRARALLAEHAHNPNWGFKDPRALLVLDGWNQLVDLDYVGIFRHPVSVVESLAGRGGFPRDRALELWLAYNERMLAVHDRAPFPVLSFDVDPDEFHAAVNAAVAELGLNPVSDADRFFADELRSNTKYREAEVPAEARDTYQRLRDLTR